MADQWRTGAPYDRKGDPRAEPKGGNVKEGSSAEEAHDDHYWDVLAQRQLSNLVDWLRHFIDPEFRLRVWQNGNGPGQFYEESATQFFDDFSLEWLLEDGLLRLDAPAKVIAAIRTFAEHYAAFNESLPMWVDAVKLESDPAFIVIVAEATAVLWTIESAQPKLREIVDDL